MLIRNNPEVLHVQHFRKKIVYKITGPTNTTLNNIDFNNACLTEGIKQLQTAVVGNRWETVQRVSYTLGGLGKHKIINNILDTIKQTSAFKGEEPKYCKCAQVCFAEGLKTPFETAVDSIWYFVKLKIEDKLKMINESGEYIGKNKYKKDVYRLHSYFVTKGVNKAGEQFIYANQEKPD